MNRLWVRLTIGFLLTLLLLLLLVTLVVNYSVTSSFRQYVNEMDVTDFGRTSFDGLTEYYRTHGTWAGGRAAASRWQRPRGAQRPWHAVVCGRR